MTVINGKEVASTKDETPKMVYQFPLRNMPASTAPPWDRCTVSGANGDCPAGARLTCIPTQISHSPLRHPLKLFRCREGWRTGQNNNQVTCKASLVAQWLRISLSVQETQV